MLEEREKQSKAKIDQIAAVSILESALLNEKTNRCIKIKVAKNQK